MKTIVIVGAGGLGSRHLQGVAKCNMDHSIEVVDPNVLSLTTAKARYKEVEDNSHTKNTRFLEELDQLTYDIDLAIVATNADVRYSVTTDLLKKKNVKNLVLEKVLFQKVEEFQEFENTLKREEVNCWVNHPRRMFPFYNKLKEDMKNAKRVSYNFQGGSWGLGCNGLHFLDHLSYLVNSNDLILDAGLLDKQIYSAKREGFVEFNGSLMGRIDNHTFSLYSGVDEAAGMLTITSDCLSVCIDELTGNCKIAYKDNNWKWEELSERVIFFQSELSGKLADEILSGGRCLLPTYQEAMKLHVPFIECLLGHESKIEGKEITTCRIT